MTRRKGARREADEEVIKSKWVSLSWKGVLGFISILILVGLFAIVILCVGYDRKHGGCYFKPLDLNIDIKEGK